MGFDAAIGALLLLTLLGAVYGPWQWVCTDVARQTIFEHRDAIFDMAHAGKLSFDSEEYRVIRGSLEKTIRYAHELTIPRFIWLAVSYKLTSTPRKSELFGAIGRISDESTRNEVMSHVAAALIAAVKSMILKSPLILIVIVPLVWLGRLMSSVLRAWIIDKTKIASSIIQSEAEAVDSMRFAS